jgi:hypothetical protein
MMSKPSYEFFGTGWPACNVLELVTELLLVFLGVDMSRAWCESQEYRNMERARVDCMKFYRDMKQRKFFNYPALKTICDHLIFITDRFVEHREEMQQFSMTQVKQFVHLTIGHSLREIPIDLTRSITNYFKSMEPIESE